jgi:O-antigen ligase
MSASIALALCTLFALYLLRLELRDNPKASFALWLPTIWLWYCGSRPLACWFAFDSITVGGDIEEGSAIDRGFVSALIVLGLIILLRRNLDWQALIRENRCLVLLYLFMAFSILWSDESWIALKRWVKAFAGLVMAFIVVSERSPREALQSVLKRSIYVLVPFSLLLIKYYPNIGVTYGQWEGERMWLGVTLQKNSLGRLCLIASFFLFWRLVINKWYRKERDSSKYRTWGDVIVLIMSLRLLIGPKGSYSATATVALMVSVTVFLSLICEKKWLKSFGFNASLAVVALMITNTFYTMLTGGSLLAWVMAKFGRESNYTGRTEVWDAILPVASRHPIGGVGYGSFWIHPDLNLPWEINEAHSGYLDVFVEIGAVGLIVLIALLVSIYLRAKWDLLRDLPWASFRIAFLFAAVIHNLSETSFLRSTNYLWALLILLAVALPRTAVRGPAVKRRQHPGKAAPLDCPVAGNGTRPVQRLVRTH